MLETKKKRSKVRIKGSYRKVINTNKTIKAENKEISPQVPPQKNKAPVNTGALFFRGGDRGEFL